MIPGRGRFAFHIPPESRIHIAPESVFTISRNAYSHAPEYAAKARTVILVALGRTERASEWVLRFEFRRTANMVLRSEQLLEFSGIPTCRLYGRTADFVADYQDLVRFGAAIGADPLR